VRVCASRAVFIQNWCFHARAFCTVHAAHTGRGSTGRPHSRPHSRSAARAACPPPPVRSSTAEPPEATAAVFLPHPLNDRRFILISFARGPPSVFGVYITSSPIMYALRRRAKTKETKIYIDRSHYRRNIIKSFH